MAKETFHLAEVEDVVELIEGDAQIHIPNYNNIAFCFLDAEKESYLELYEIIIEKMISGGLLAADNVISHLQTLQPFVDQIESDPRVDSVVVPIGKGVLVCRKV